MRVAREPFGRTISVVSIFGKSVFRMILTIFAGGIRADSISTLLH